MRYLIVLLGLLAISGCAESVIKPTPPPTARPVQTLAGYEGKPVRLIVQEGAYGMQERALQEMDFKTLTWIWESYEFLDVPSGVRVRIVRDTPSGVQVDILDGAQTGRRGWMSPKYLQH